ncbi:hypothetical protein CYG49_00800 [Candidatus Saccharibacteria bacterium]|nr:MAG: hypothetical protein CYG49_00800 [Candidatus Saccharibacteria bacterium]
MSSSLISTWSELLTSGLAATAETLKPYNHYAIVEPAKDDALAAPANGYVTVSGVYTLPRDWGVFKRGDHVFIVQEGPLSSTPPYVDRRHSDASERDAVSHGLVPDPSRSPARLLVLASDLPKLQFTTELGLPELEHELLYGPVD